MENNIYREYKKRKNKSPIFIVGYVVVAVFCVVLMIVLGAFGKDDKNISSLLTESEVSSRMTFSEVETSSAIETSSEVSTSSTVSTSSKIPTSSKTPTSSAAVIDTTETASAYLPNGDWRLIVANKQYPLPKSYVINTSYIGAYRLDERIVDAYKSMINAAKNDGITLVLISGFRTYDGQTTLFNNKVNQYINRGYSRDKAKELAAQYVAPPGTSEHLTGLAVDLISNNWYTYNSDLNSNFENTKEFEWLINHCAEYGFILRYPKDKVDVTGYSYEPWHYRYVGVDAAKEIMSRKICLEEYVKEI